MSVASPLSLTHRHFTLPQSLHPKLVEQAEEFTVASAVAAFRAAERAQADWDALVADRQAAADALQKARDDYAAAQPEFNRRQSAIEQARSTGPRARGFLLRASGTVQSAEEIAQHQRGLDLQIKAGQTQARGRAFAASMAPPAETELGREVASLEAAVAEAQAYCNKNSGDSGRENLLQRLTRELGEIKPRHDAYSRQYAVWQEVRSIKAEAEGCFAERDRLRVERESAALAAALKSK
jgi:hypothetical protein